MSDRPPIIIEHEGWRYRRVGPVGARMGRPPKGSRTVGGAEEWLCPCCDEWKVGKLFHSSASSSNGLQSWCKECMAEDKRMRRAMWGPGTPNDDWRKNE
jgi:hypothetical protein